VTDRGKDSAPGKYRLAFHATCCDMLTLAGPVLAGEYRWMLGADVRHAGRDATDLGVVIGMGEVGD
jgi:hypothetical protein